MTEQTIQSGAIPQFALRALPFKFNGSGKEYFGIWIVNILLTVVTLGIYSAWAKVRNERYFKGSTELDGHRFDYHATGQQIFVGRAIAFGVLVGLNIALEFAPLVGLALLVIGLFFIPWIFVRGIRFNANMTSYRNVRFHFHGTVGQAFLAYFVWPILSILTLYLLLPFASRSNAKFLGNGHAYGTARFSANPPVISYYKALGITAVAFVAVALSYAAIIAALNSLGLFPSGDEVDLTDLTTVFTSGVGIVIGVLAYVAIIIIFFIYAAYSRNIGFNNLHLEGGHEFRSTVTARGYAWITVTNVILTVLTIGLFIPWAKVRMVRYHVDNTEAFAASNLDEFVEGKLDQSGVVSGELLTAEGVEFGF